MLGLIQFNVCVEDIIPSKDLQLIRTNVILWNLDDIRGDFGLIADFIFLNQSERGSHTFSWLILIDLYLLAKLLCAFQLSKKFLSAFVCKIISCIKSINYNHEIDEILIYRDRGMMEASLFCRQMQTKNIWLFQKYFYRKYTNRLTWRRVFVRPRTNRVLIH